jgi:hypothetical protein
MRPLLPAILALLPLAAPGIASAGDFYRLTDRDAFVSLVDGKELVLPFFGVELTVKPTGEIDGAAQGWPITGEWGWKDGYFCRTMYWGEMEIPANCQLVEVKDGQRMRFTTDQGEGQSATFWLN